VGRGERSSVECGFCNGSIEKCGITSKPASPRSVEGSFYSSLIRRAATWVLRGLIIPVSDQGSEHLRNSEKELVKGLNKYLW